MTRLYGRHRSVRWARYLIALVVIVLVVMWWSASARATPQTAQSGSAKAALIEIIETGLPAQKVPAWMRSALNEVYGQRAYAPAWTRARETQLVEILKNAGAEGLQPSDYELANFSALGAKDAAAREIMLSIAALQFASDLATGRTEPGKQRPDIFAYGSSLRPAARLGAILNAPDLAEYMRQQAPANDYYSDLRTALAVYRDIAASGGWPAITPGKKIKRGDKGPRVSEVRARLLVSGDFVPDNIMEPPSGNFDESLHAAVIRFQERHGLLADGIVGRRTQTMLGASVEHRIKQIVANMERWRWRPLALGQRYVLVNLAGYQGQLVEGGKVVLESRVIVGRADRASPEFSDMIRYIEFNPTWTVPKSIFRKDLMPKILANYDYLSNNGFDVFQGGQSISPYSVDWEQYRGGTPPVTLRQAPGRKNALGRMKFMFPNGYSIYLHDTPSRQLFNKTFRNFSSGCVRVEQSLELAQMLLAQNPKWSAAKIRSVLDDEKTTRASLQTPVPVHLFYMTAWRDDQGRVQFRNDPYKLDKALTKALEDRQAYNS